MEPERSSVFYRLDVDARCEQRLLRQSRSGVRVGRPDAVLQLNAVREVDHNRQLRVVALPTVLRIIPAETDADKGGFPRFIRRAGHQCRCRTADVSPNKTLK